MNRGIIKFFNEDKGFGFIKDDNTGEEFFFHVSELKNRVEKDDQVTFDVARGRKGMNAVNINLA